MPYPMLTADKRHVFSFQENGKNQFRGFKTKKYIQFISFPRLLRPVSDCSVKKHTSILLQNNIKSKLNCKIDEIDNKSH